MVQLTNYRIYLLVGLQHTVQSAVAAWHVLPYHEEARAACQR